jgi:hypothetical protein
MKARFPGYYRPTDAELATLWSECFFLPDTNILLHLFRYGANTRAQVIEIISALKPRVWIPYRVGLEFHRRWRDVDQTNRDAYDKLSNEIGSHGQKLRALFDEYTRHQIIDAKQEQATIDEFIAGFNKRLLRSKAKHPSRQEAETIFHQVSELIGDAVGQRPSANEIQKIEKEGDSRYAASIPPGYRDAKKEGLDKYGDLLIWKEALEKAKIENKPIVIITDDFKGDWWHEFRGEKIGPRAELVEEMREYAGQQFYLYTLSQFLDYAKTFLKRNIDAEAIDEIKSDEKQLREVARRSADQTFKGEDLNVFVAEERLRERIRTLRGRLYNINQVIDAVSNEPKAAKIGELLSLREKTENDLERAHELFHAAKEQSHIFQEQLIDSLRSNLTVSTAEDYASAQKAFRRDSTRRKDIDNKRDE